MRRRILRQQGNRCAACRDLTSPGELDHITPLALGGSEAPSNLQVLCHRCHVDKTREDRRAVRDVRRADAEPTP
jgi:5-methylcytosine-specific restriction protein A